MGLFPKSKYSSQLENIIQSINQNPLQPHKMKSLKGCNTGTPASAGMTATKPFTKLNIFENNNNNIFLPPTMEAELLQKLFNDSEILGMGAYGLHLPKDTTNDRNGSELMAYQPMYDLSDIINEQSDLDADNNSMMRPQITQEPDSSTKQNDVQPSSGLNTPYHE